MRVAILTNAYPPDGRGGAERIAWLQAEGLKSRGHEVCVWAPAGKGGEGERGSGRAGERRFESDFGNLGRMNPIARLFFHLRDLAPRRDVANEIIAWKPDALITHNLTGCGFGTAAFAKRTGVRWIHVLHDVQLAEPSGQIRARGNEGTRERSVSAWRFIWSRLRRSAFGRPDVFMSPSAWLLDWHHAYGFSGKKEIVVPNPVETGALRERSLRTPATIAYIGRLSEDKGFGGVLAMISQLDPTRIGVLVIVGDGPMKDRISPSVGSLKIDVRGTLPPDEARRVIADADIVLVPSRILENQPTVILEAMAEGTPVIATDVGGVAELLNGTDTPVLPILDDLAERLARETNALASDPERWARISSVSKRRAEERHGMDVYLSAVERGIANV